MDDDTTEHFDTDSIDRVLAEYFAAREEDPDVDLAPFLAQLSSDSERDLARRVVRKGDRSLMADGSIREGALVDGRYRLRERIGSGGMGAVWSAFDTNVGEDVAIKVLNPAAAASLGHADRIDDEVRLMQKIDHPGVAVVRDFRRSDDRTYFVMDLVDGVALSDLLKRVRECAVRPNGSGLSRLIGRPAPDGQASLIGNEDWYRSVARIAVGILQVLEAAHAKRIVHRDIKPSNIMLRGGGLPVLLDFGLARSSDAQSHELTQGLSGTIPYLAPEQIESHKTGASPSSDIYQMGAVLYEFLTLQRAIEGDSTAQVLANITKRGVRNPRDRDGAVPRELADICLRAMEHAPERRYRTIRGFREDLERYLDGTELPEACRGSTARRVRYFARRRKVELSIAATALSTLGIASVLMSPTKLMDTIESATVEQTPFGVDREIYSVEQKLELHDACDVHALLFVERGGHQFVYPMFTAETRQSILVLERGKPVVRWESDPILTGGSRKVEMFASAIPAGLKRDFENLVRFAREHDGGRGVPLKVAATVLAQLRDATRASDDPVKFSVDMLLGGESLGSNGQRIILVDQPGAQE